MSVSIATMGMFRECCVSPQMGGGGAPPYNPNAEEVVRPTVQVHNVEMTTKNSKEKILNNISVKFKDMK